MIIHIEICDSCGLVQHGLPLQPFEAKGVRYEICAVCQEQPFRVFDTRERQKVLQKRIEALIETERKLGAQA